MHYGELYNDNKDYLEKIEVGLPDSNNKDHDIIMFVDADEFDTTTNVIIEEMYIISSGKKRRIVPEKLNDNKYAYLEEAAYEHFTGGLV